MGKTLRDEDLRLNLIINGDNGQKTIEDLRRTVADGKVAMEGLVDQQKQMAAQGKKNTPEYKTLTAEIGKQNKVLDEQRDRLGRLIRQQSLETMTLGDLQQHLKLTSIAFKKAEPGTTAWRKLQQEIQQTESRIRELKGSATAAGGFIKRMAGGFSKFFGAFAAGFASFSFAVLGIKKARASFLEYDEALTDAQKTTNTTKTQIQEVSEELKKIDTRTAQNALLDIVRVAGKLGIKGVENLVAFARAGDKIGVALARDLGGNAEAAITQIGKLVDIFHLKEKFGIEDAMLKVGSAINDLGMASTAAEGYIVEFARRAAGTAPNVDISIQSVLGLGATLDKFGQTAETSGTAYGQVISAMYKRTEVFAKIAKMTLGDFRKLMDEDMNEAFIRVLEGMGKSGNGMQSIVNALNSMKLDGQRSVQVLGALAANTDTLRQQQELANKAFAEGTSIQKEFGTKNESATAIYEKQKNALRAQAVILGETLNPAFTASASAGVTLLKVITALVKWFYETKGAIISIATAYVGYITVLKVVAVAKKIATFWGKAHRLALLEEATAMKAVGVATVATTKSTKFFLAIQNLLVLNFRAAGVAAKAFFLSLGPVGWAAAAIGVLAGAIAIVKTRTSEAAKAQRLLNDVNKRAATIEDEHGVNLAGKAEKIRLLMREIEDTTTAEKRRIDAVKELQGLMPNGIELINQETIANGKASAAVKQYTEQLLLQATAKAAAQKREELIEQAGKDRVSGDDKKVGWVKRLLLQKMSLDIFQDFDSLVADQEAKNAANYQANLDKQVAGLDKILADTAARIAEKKLTVTAPQVEVDDNSPKSNIDLEAKNKKWSLDKDKAFLAEKFKLQEQYRNGAIASEAELNVALRKQEIKSLEDRLALNKESGEDRLKLQSQLEDKRTEQQKYELQQAETAENLRIQNILDAEAQENASYEQQKKQYAGNAEALEQLARGHERRVTKIRLDNAMKVLKQLENDYTQQRRILQEQHKVELSDATLSRTQKTRLKREQTNELKNFDAEYLQSVLDKVRELSLTGKISFKDLEGLVRSIDLDTNLLSEEEKESLRRRIQEITTELEAAKQTVEEVGYSFSNRQGDIFGFSAEDWGKFFENLKAGKFGADEMALALAATANAGQMALDLYSTYDRMMTAKENAEFKRYQKNQDKKKKINQDRVKLGLMTEEQASAEDERMQAEADAKQEGLEIKQAKRQKAMSITQAIINTALGITAALTAGPIIGPIMAAIAAAMGAAQIAMIASTPIAGAEEGGPVVERMQDGRKFKAKYAPDKRGFITSPTVLVSENGTEYVVPGEGMQNPTLRPILNTIEAARRQGSLASFDFNAVYRQPPQVPGFTSGGATGPPTTFDSTTSATPSSTNVDVAMLAQLSRAVEKLIRKLDDPFMAFITMHGQNGLWEQFEKYKQNRNRGKLGG